MEAAAGAAACGGSRLTGLLATVPPLKRTGLTLILILIVLLIMIVICICICIYIYAREQTALQSTRRR